MLMDESVWLNQDSCCISEFKTLVEVETSAEHVPLAHTINANIPIYAAAEVLAALHSDDQTKAYQAEWQRVFTHGAGIIVIRNAYADTQIIDDASQVLNAIIEQEASSQTGAGDHFAAAGANSRVWNAHEKLCVAAPEVFAHYNANHIIALASRAWLGPLYQITAQVNVVHPGGKAQVAHRDYHMGFQSAEVLAQYPAHVHALSAALTLQGAIAHSDMSIESGPTKLLPYSQRYLPGYIAAGLAEFQAYFETHCSQLPLQKGDALFFNPAVFHAAGENKTTDFQRFANLLQIGSGYGRSIELVDRQRMCAALYPTLLDLQRTQALDTDEIENVIAACAEGYSFPANLDLDSPLTGMAPPSQQDLLRQALQENWPHEQFRQALQAQSERKRSH